MTRSELQQLVDRLPEYLMDGPDRGRLVPTFGDLHELSEVLTELAIKLGDVSARMDGAAAETAVFTAPVKSPTEPWRCPRGALTLAGHRACACAFCTRDHWPKFASSVRARRDSAPRSTRAVLSRRQLSSRQCHQVLCCLGPKCTHVPLGALRSCLVGVAAASNPQLEESKWLPRLTVAPGAPAVAVALTRSSPADGCSC